VNLFRWNLGAGACNGDETWSNEVRVGTVGSEERCIEERREGVEDELERHRGTGLKVEEKEERTILGRGLEGAGSGRAASAVLVGTRGGTRIGGLKDVQ
jgi:hypothetical protein